MKKLIYLPLVAILFIVASCSTGSKNVGLVYVDLSDAFYEGVSQKDTTPDVDTVMIDGEMVIEETIYNVVVEQAEFPGGTKAFYKWVQNEIKYPSEGLDEGLQGTALLAFTIDTDGSVIDVVAVKSTSHMCLDKEALRVIKATPKWKPFKLGGEPVKCTFKISITFKILPPSQK